MAHPVAVLTGDLIASSDATPEVVEAAIQEIESSAEQIARSTGKATHFTRFRGDGWQVYLDMPGDCLWACLYIQARLRARGMLATRIAVGVGEGRLPEGGGLSAAMGPAFTLSGRALDTMDKRDILTLAGAERDRYEERAGQKICVEPTVGRFEKLIFTFAADHVRRWSSQQAEAMALSLPPASINQTEIAAHLGITRQAVGARLAAAGHMLLEDAWVAFKYKYRETFTLNVRSGDYTMVPHGLGDNA